jgi:hypothetical protein
MEDQQSSASPNELLPIPEPRLLKPEPKRLAQSTKSKTTMSNSRNEPEVLSLDDPLSAMS